MADDEQSESVEEPDGVSPEDPQAGQPAEPSEEAAAPAAPAAEVSPTSSPEAEDDVPAEILLAEETAVEAPVEQSAPPAPEAAPPAPEAEASEEEDEEPAPREKPSVPGAHLEVDIVPEGVDPLGRADAYEDSYSVDPYATDEEGEEQGSEEEREEALTEPIATAAIDLASGARYRATGKRKSAIARVTLRPGSGSYLVNGRTLEEHFPRLTLQRNIRQPLETVGYQDRMDVVARLHGGGISAQAGALRHGVSRALLEADPNLRGELKRRGFLTRDSRAKERKKAGLKKARKRPQFSKR
jgi:small subunit ribosomal protein S9